MRCGFWRYKECEGLSEAGLKLVTNMDVWFCKNCSSEWMLEKEENSRMKEELRGLKMKNAEINNKVKDFENKWSKEVDESDEADPSPENKQGEREAGEKPTGMLHIKDEIKKLRKANEEFKEMIVNLEEKWESREEEMIKKVMDKVVEHLGEIQEKEKKKKNIIIFNIPESKKAEIGDRVSDDKKKCEEVFQGALRIRDAKIERIFRIGRENNGKIRPVIVELSEVETKWELIKRSKCLKDEDNPEMKQVIIAPDLTRKEREENDKLREELKQRRQNGGRWIIRKGKVIKLHNGDEERDN